MSRMADEHQILELRLLGWDKEVEICQAEYKQWQASSIDATGASS